MSIIPSPGDWITTELSNVVVKQGGVQTGPFGSQLHQKDYVAVGTPIITVEHLGENRISHINLPCVSDEDRSRLSKYSLETGDIVFSRVGSVDRRSLVREEENGWLFSGRCLRVRAQKDKIDPVFLSYYLGDTRVKNFIRAIAVGATMPSINTKILSDLPVTSPPAIVQQKAIAHTLGTLDDKIELNQKMNQTLEEVAKATFKSWFVDFDPVRAKVEGHPTGLPPEISDLFPDELVASEIGEIPREWTSGQLSDVADVTMGQSPPGDTYNDEGDGLPFYQGSTDFGFRFPSLRKYCSAPKRLASIDDVLLSVRAPVGDLNRAKSDCCIGRGLSSIRSKNGTSSWIFYRCSFFKEQFDIFNSEGTVFGSINGKDLKAFPIIIPTITVLSAFENLAKPIDQAIRIRTEEIRVLTDLRETLLPKLISGELSIPDTEKFLEGAGI